MFVHRSNRSERLVDALASIVRAPLSDALAPEVIVVHSKGMERWLAMQLSQRLGVFANGQFPFPRHVIEQLEDLVLGDASERAAAFDPRATSWAIAALLPAQLSDPAFQPIAHYLAADTDGSLVLQLAQRIARVFDDYAVYRPHMLLDWERGSDSGWEARLWRALCERLGRGHPAARAQRFIQAIERGEFDRDRLPQRVCLFGVSSLPPLYLSVLAALAAHIETHLFVLSPSREYFADLSRRPDADDASTATPPLLASLGRLGREFQALLEERTQYVEPDEDLYEDPGTDSVLHTLQSDMLAVRSRGGGPGQTPRGSISRGDASLAVHVCHSRIRELEVLHDQLVELLQDRSLEPHEIVVMTPDIEAYAPGIEAVFGEKSGRPALPYCVADRSTRSTHPVVQALFSLLDTLRGRLTASAVLDLLSLDCVRRRFLIEAEDMDLLRAWIEDCGIRWGADADHRAEVGQPAFSDNTWRRGLDRMLLGYAMPQDGQRLYRGVLPFEAAEGGGAQLLGKLAQACEALFAHRTALTGAHTLPAWRRVLLGVLADSVDAQGEHAYEHQLIRAALDRIVDDAERGGFDGSVELAGVTAQLEAALDDRLPARGLLARGITFCQLVPMRGIPFQVVCLIGMNDDAFPGRSVKLGFDRMADAGTRMLGDRNRRDDDRYLFLEALLCARTRLLISYVGRGVRDNRVLPPSVLVDELLDATLHAFEPDRAQPHEAERTALERRLCVVHRLHAFSPRYFEAEREPGLFSYAQHACQAARALGGQRGDPPLLSRALPAGAPLRELTIDALVNWISLPLRSFMQRQLGLYLGSELTALSAREPLDLDGLDRWQLGTDLLNLALRGSDLSEMIAVARGTGQLPLGNVGALAYEELWPQVRGLAQAATRHRAGSPLPPLGVELEVAGVRLTGTLHGLWPSAHLLASFSRLGRRFELVHFVRHVVLCCWLRQNRAFSIGYPDRSVVVARSADADGVGELHFEPLHDPEALLADLLGVVQAAQSCALPFVYDVSRSYLETLRTAADRDPERALRNSERMFDDPHRPLDAYVKMAYPDFASLCRRDDAFAFTSLAQRVIGPLLEHGRVVRADASNGPSA